MNSFERIGEAQVLALEGNRQIAEALAALMKKAFLGLLRAVARSSPGPFMP